MRKAGKSRVSLQRVRLKLANRPGAEKEAMSAAARIAGQAGLRPDRIDDLKTAVAEACLNAIEHGVRPGRTRGVEVEIRLREDRSRSRC